MRLLIAPVILAALGTAAAAEPPADGRIRVQKFPYDAPRPVTADVVIFKYPHTDPPADYVKRLVGLPGERVVVRDGELTKVRPRVETITVEGGRVEITGETIRIDGGKVTIRRTSER